MSLRTMQEQLKGREQPRVFATRPESPEEGRIFVWARARWYERVEGETGAVAFSPIADSEAELRERLHPQADVLTEINQEFAEGVRDEFRSQEPLYPEAPELSDQET